MQSYPSLAGEELHDRRARRELRHRPGQRRADLPQRGRAGGVRRRSTRPTCDKFGFPLIIAARELTSEQVLEQAWHRLDNSPTQEHAAALLEIAKIANHRLDDVVADTAPMGSIRSASLQRRLLARMDEREGRASSGCPAPLDHFNEESSSPCDLGCSP